jgi:Gly-Xaa carboxypeptidase
LDRWTYPPFEGKIDHEWLYGRGAADCKNNVIGILSAVEHLLKEGWEPERTIREYTASTLLVHLS